MHLRIPTLGALALPVLLVACGPHGDPHGDALFHGREPVTGRLFGDATPLPAIATKCSNCHEKDNVSPTTGKSGKSYAPRLDHAWLTENRVRRGGPASHFDEKSFCALLREGIDPVHIIISTTMPRYELSDGDCTRLWRYLDAR